MHCTKKSFQRPGGRLFWTRSVIVRLLSWVASVYTQKRRWIGIDIWKKSNDAVITRQESEGSIAPKYIRKTAIPMGRGTALY